MGTIAYADELPNVAVLVDSFQRFHQETEFPVLVIARPDEEITLPKAAVWRLHDLGLDPGEEWRLPMLFRRNELRWLLKPVLLEAMFRRGAATAAYLSPTTEIFSSLLAMLNSVGEGDEIVATPPIKNEMGDCGRGFVAAPHGARALLRDWFDKMRALSDPKVASSMDDPQPFEALFDAVPQRVSSEPGLGVNYTNLDPASLRRSQQGYEIDGRPLQTFDFRGYDSAKPHLLSRYQGLAPRILLSEWPVLAELCDDYRQKLIDAGERADRRQQYPFDFLPSGLQLDRRMLQTYRTALAQHRPGKTDEPPSPFGPAGEKRFLEWLNEPVDQAQAGVTRYMLAVYDDREDVQQVFSDPMKADAVGFRDWYWAFGRHELDLPSALVPSPPPESPAPTAPQTCVNIAGYFRAELGIGTAARSLVTALEASDIPFNTISFDATANRQSHLFMDRQTESAADINIVCVNAAELPAFVREAGPELFHGRYTIGVWFWEVEDFPQAFHDSFNYVDEVWVASEFMRETFLKVSPKPVFKFRLPVPTPSVDRSVTRTQLGLPEEFLFLFSFDFLSVLERKNPLGLIEAFCRAFPAKQGPRLVIKTINGDKRILEMEKLKHASRNRPDILLIDGYLPAVENATFTALADCYVSLHRSEGFGLTIAEAMALGKPVIATAYSGNLEFMTAENSYLCPARRAEVGPEREPYPPDSHWSEPDIQAASELLRDVFENQNEARARGTRAARDITSLHGPEMAGAIIKDRLATIRRRRMSPGPRRSVEFLQDRLEELEAQNTKPRNPGRSADR